MHYIVIYLISFVGTKFFGLEGTILKMKRLGTFLRRFYSFRDSPEIISRRLDTSMPLVPVNVKCLDQAVVAWFALNLHGHSAILRIGMSITPLESHAWVVQGENTFVKANNIPDLHVVAEYEGWDRH